MPKQLNFRASDVLDERIEAFVQHRLRTRPEIPIKTSDAIRILLTMGLEKARADEGMGDESTR